MRKQRKYPNPKMKRERAHLTQTKKQPENLQKLNLKKPFQKVRVFYHRKQTPNPNLRRMRKQRKYPNPKMKKERAHLTQTENLQKLNLKKPRRNLLPNLNL